ncbi:ribonuclease Y-like [Clytia hemisphaerica]
MAQFAEKKRPMNWTPRHDEILVQEILLFEPWTQKKGSPERGSTWSAIADNLNQIDNPFFSVNQRSVRDHYNVLEGNFKRKRNAQEKASGTAYPEDTVFDNGMNDIIQQFHDYDVLLAKEKQAKEDEENKEKEQAQQIVKASLETFRETQKRKAEAGEEPVSSKKTRRSETETLVYLREKNESNIKLQEQQLELQKQELELRKQQMDNFNQVLTNSQNQTNAILQQQQNLSLALLQILNKQKEESK